MNIYTSYFAQLRNLQKKDIFPISIARFSPKWYKGLRVLDVAPEPYMLRDSETREKYILDYQKILNSLNVEAFIEKIEKLSGGKDVALLCYEKPNEFCHRHLLADFLNQKGYSIEEFVEQNQKTGMTLF